MKLVRNIVVAVVMAVVSLVCGAVAGAVVDGAHGGGVGVEGSASDEGVPVSVVEREGMEVDAAFIASGRTAEAAFSSSSNVFTPAQVPAQRRIDSSERTSLERTLAEHIGSTVTACRFGLLDFKHIIYSNHSFLFIIAVLVI